MTSPISKEYLNNIVRTELEDFLESLNNEGYFLYKSETDRPEISVDSGFVSPEETKRLINSFINFA